MTEKPREFTWQDFGSTIDEAVNKLTDNKPFDGRVLLQGISAFTANIMAAMNDDSLLTSFIGEVIGDYLHCTGRCACHKQEKEEPTHEDPEVAAAMKEARSATKN